MALYAFDGTWNWERTTGEYGKNTNVVKFHRAYLGAEDDDFYTKGVGTRHGKLGQLFGGAFGFGGKRRLGKARARLYENYAAGNTEIDVVGFSRGAALALAFVNKITRQGIRHPDTDEVLEANPTIRFLGLWDVVAAFGIPINFGIPFQRINLGYRLGLPKNVQHCFHAISLDERRQTFRVTRVPRGYEVWFRGVHSDVGGGNENIPLNDIALQWMLRKAIAVGLPIDPEIPASLESDPRAEISGNGLDLIKNKPRKITVRDWIHHTVQDREGHHNPPAEAPRETDEHEAPKAPA
ncbi:MAG: DUF2235 domain-containing protein [Thermoanaerobaculia bacterium]